MCGSTLFPDGTGNKVHTRYLRLFSDFSQTSRYAWGAAVLAHLYNNLSRYAMDKNSGIFGCVTLLQVWTYEHLHDFICMFNFIYLYVWEYERLIVNASGMVI